MAAETVRDSGDGTQAWYWSLMLEAAKGGYVDAGMDALRECEIQIGRSNMEEPWRGYLRDALSAIVEGVKPERALCIEIERGAGRPPDPFPEWEMPLAVLAAMLDRRGYKAERINDAMALFWQSRESSRKTMKKTLDRKEAQRIRKTYVVMTTYSDRMLAYFCEEYKVAGEIEKYPPQP